MRFSRTRLLVGDEGMERLCNAYVGVFGLGGVGSYALEALARAGVGRLLLVDCDDVESSNINRQLLALDNTVGRPKVEVARERIHLINPDAEVETAKTFVTSEIAASLIQRGIGFAIDAIDALGAKVYLILSLHASGVRFVSAMGAASKLGVRDIRVADISDTRHCPLARRIRQRLKRHGVVRGVRCVYSEELPKGPQEPVVLDEEDDAESSGAEAKALKRRVLGSISYVPGIIGLTAAGVIISDILNVSEPE